MKILPKTTKNTVSKKQEGNIVHIVNHLHDNYGLDLVTVYSCE